MNCKPREPKRFKPKPKKSRTQWRSGRVIKKGRDMKELRAEAMERAQGYCESCGVARIFDNTAEMHHVQKRSHGGSDILENVQMLCRPCHRAAHGERKAA